MRSLLVVGANYQYGCDLSIPSCTFYNSFSIAIPNRSWAVVLLFLNVTTCVPLFTLLLPNLAIWPASSGVSLWYKLLSKTRGLQWYYYHNNKKFPFFLFFYPNSSSSALCIVADGFSAMPSALMIFLSLCFVSICFALQVTPGSVCAEACLDSPNGDANDPASSNTNTADVTCADNEYLVTGIGSKYKSCLKCLMTSDTFDEETDENDVSWFLCKWSQEGVLGVANPSHYSTPRTSSPPCCVSGDTF